jgi:hypothetical protein
MEFTMNFEILDDSGAVINKIVADLAFVEAIHPGRYRQLPEDLSFITAERSQEVRAQRDHLLSASDWTQVLDAPVDRQAWAAYRQALRDIPQQPGFPLDVQWPEQPA